MRILLATALLLPLLTLTACQSCPTRSTPCTECKMSEKGVYRHVVVFKFKDTATPEQIQDVIDGFANLQNEIDQIIGYEHGKNVSPEGHDQGFEHVFVVTFADDSGIQAYIPHPAHQAYVQTLGPVIDGVFVVDYITE